MGKRLPFQETSFIPPGKSEPSRAQGAYLSSEDTENLMGWYADRREARRAVFAAQGLVLEEASTAEPDILEAIRASAQEVDRLTQLAEDLLLIARSDRGRLPLRVETLDPAELFASVVNRFQWRAEATQRPPSPDRSANLQQTTPLTPSPRVDCHETRQRRTTTLSPTR